MPNYKIINTDILLNQTLHKEGSTISLTEKEAESLSDFLVPIPDTSKPKSSASKKPKENKNKVEE